MRFRTRLSRLEKKADQVNVIPQQDRIALVSTCGLNDAKLEEKCAKIEKEYLEKYGTIEGLIIILSAVPPPDPLPDDIEIDL